MALRTLPAFPHLLILPPLTTIMRPDTIYYAYAWNGWNHTGPVKETAESITARLAEEGCSHGFPRAYLFAIPREAYTYGTPVDMPVAVAAKVRLWRADLPSAQGRAYEVASVSPQSCPRDYMQRFQPGSLQFREELANMFNLTCFL